ncbi:MAG: hypothetical protein ACQES2_01535 [Pseudomonadota bacterium]
MIMRLIERLKNWLGSGQGRDHVPTDHHDIGGPHGESAAVPPEHETEELHHGRRRLKEDYTSHWDLDYLPKEEVDKLIEEREKDN